MATITTTDSNTYNIEVSAGENTITLATENTYVDKNIIFNIPSTYTDGTATSSDIVLNKTAYVSGELVTGNMPNANGNNSGAGFTYTNSYISFTDLVANYHSSYTDSVSTGLGFLCAVNQKSYLDTGSLYIPTTIKEIGATTYTPTTTDQTIPANLYLYEAQTIAGDANLVAENIKSGISIFGVTGTCESGGIDTSDATATVDDIVLGQTAYVNGVKITGTLEYQAYYTGTDVPSDDLGEDGDLYFKTTSGGDTTGSTLGAISSTDNSISLTDTSLASDTYTLYYEDASGNKLEGWNSIGTITN